jgi:hypothetical protein
MNSERFFQVLLIFGTTLFMVGTLLFFNQGAFPLMSSNHHSSSLVAQSVNEYLGPSKKVTGNPQLVRVQVLINDDPNPQGVQIVDAQLDQQFISLKPRDIYGFRGQSSFQMPPGKYKLRWTVHRDKFAWPRTIKREEEVTISPRDLWIQITITGEKASIS